MPKSMLDGKHHNLAIPSNLNCQTRNINFFADSCTQELETIGRSALRQDLNQIDADFAEIGLGKGVNLLDFKNNKPK